MMSTVPFKPCFIVPLYNHGATLTATLNALSQFNLPILVVDDGSNDETKAILAEQVAAHPLCQSLTLAQNLGKGGAVMAGMRHQFKAGFSHALQIDADGQHNLADIPAMLASAELNPCDLIAGVPVYDNSIPKGRLYGRYVTHVWVWIETLSLELKDTMCGFRVYPLAPCCQLLTQQKLGQRMDFDIEIMVRLYWQGIAFKQLPTQVIYPKDGISHFRGWADNVLISKMHTKLFFGMLIRIPKLLAMKWQRYQQPQGID
ncbi:glycosyltransferase family 2 protein [Motilimonas cestriensis]|uniref:glycosyltransferase family 2 protein n=1 Tax=Motilimonas cestriensis TaxID=2742685 RepID=UPI003DA2E1F0